MPRWQLLFNLGVLGILLLFVGSFYWHETHSPRHLMLRLSDPDVHVRILAAQNLGEMGVKAKDAAPELLRQATSDENQDAAASAADALGRIDLRTSREAVQILLPRLKTGDRYVRLQTTVVLGGLGPVAKPAVPALLEAMRDPDASVRGGIVDALGSIGIPSTVVVPALIQAFDDPDRIVRDRAAAVFNFSMPSGTRAYAASVLSHHVHNDPLVAEFVQSTLVQVNAVKRNDAQILQIFMGMERSYALHQLAIIGPAAVAAVSSLINALGDQYPLNRYLAAEALGAIGPQAKDAVPTLIRTLTDSDQVVRESATQALRAIGTPEALQSLKGM